MRILLVGSNRTTKGGIATVLHSWMQMDIFRGGKSGWLEIQSNKSLVDKIYHLITAYIKMIWLIPTHDVVHFHSTPGICVWIHMPVLIYAKLWRRKIIIHLHVGNQIELYKHNKPFLFFLNQATKIVALAKVWENKLAELGIDPKRITTIYNPSPKISEMTKKENYILFMAYMNKNKGYDVLVKAFANIAKDFPSWHLEMAGVGETDELRCMVKDLGIESQVNIHEWVVGNEKANLFMKASAYCMASYMEGFPMSVLEAYSYSVPLITTLVGGLVDIIEDKKNALVFNFGDQEKLEELLVLIMSDENLRNQLSIESRKMAETIFNISTIEKQLDKLYKGL